MPTGIPTVGEVTALLAASSFAVPDGYDLQGDVDAAVDELESLTSKRPFLAPAADAPATTHVYSPPPSSVRRGAIATLDGYGLDRSDAYAGGGTVLELGVKCLRLDSIEWGDPDDPNVVAVGQRWLENGGMSIRLLAPIYGYPQTIRVTGRFGWYAELPAAVRRALIRFAAGLALSTKREELMAEGVTSWDEAGIKETRGYEMTRQIGQGYLDDARNVFKRHRRLVL